MVRARCWTCPLLLAALAVGSRAEADEAQGARAEARQLANEGDEAFATGRCDRAVPLWRDADRKYHAPTIVLRIARCQALLGQVVAAAGALEGIVSEPPAEGEPPAFQQARAEAAAELRTIRARIARVSVVVDAAGLQGVAAVEVDGRAVDSFEQAMAPGKHRVRVSLGEASWEDTVRLGDGDARTVRVSFRAQPAPVASAPQRTAGLVLGGAGMAAMAVGAAFGYAAVEASHDLLGPCGQSRQHCPPGEQPAIDRVRTESLVSDVTLGGGATLFLAGAIVVLTAPAPRREAPRIEVIPWMGQGVGAAVGGAF